MVEVVEAEGDVVLRISDEGKGSLPRRPSSGFGLLGMQDRVKLAGGKLQVRAKPGEGTFLEAQLPAEHREPADRASELDIARAKL